MTLKPNNYPAIRLRSKNELAKQISSMKRKPSSSLKLINDVVNNYDNYWKDHPKLSQPEKGKWVRDSSRTNLGKLLRDIDKHVLRPHDDLVPKFIFGGLTGLNHKAAVLHLLGRRRNRTVLKLDITKFFEQISQERVYHLFYSKCECSKVASNLLASLCCVPYGPKEKPEDHNTIARGYPTSPRLAVWCNLDTFIRIERVVARELKGKDPRIAIYVDDIAVTASDVSVEEMMKLYPKIKDILENGDKNQKLPLNHAKTKIIKHSGETYDIEGNYQGKWAFEHLGLQMNRNSVTLGTKTRRKLRNTNQDYKKSERKDRLIRRKQKSLLLYKSYIEK